MEIVLVMLTSCFADYFSAIIIEKGQKKLGLAISILVNLSLLGFFKYANFAFENFNVLLDFIGINSEEIIKLPEIALPLGISFYTFQTMSYTIDVYRGNVKANRNFIDFAAYVTMFPQLVAGPIVRYKDINKQLQGRKESVSKFTEGIERFIIGLSKKMIIANTFAVIADNVFALETGNLSMGMAWMGTIAYTIQIYFDFSGYSDMAIGLGKMFGFDFLENFNYPYISRSIKEFWRRWHISLSTWFRDYVYISLGGNRVKTSKVYINLMIVFFVTGLWHGASWNFIVWGLYHGLFLIIERLGLEKKLIKAWRPLSHIYVLGVVTAGWVLFRADNLTHAINYLGVMYGSNGIGVEGILEFKNRETFFIGCLALIFSLPVYHYIKNKVSQLLPSESFGKASLVLGFNLFLIVLLIISSAYIAADSYNPFIYFRF